MFGTIIEVKRSDVQERGSLKGRGSWRGESGRERGVAGQRLVSEEKEKIERI